MIAGCETPQPTAATPPQPQAQIDAAEIIYVGGDIVTINDKQPSAEALAVKGGKILAVGARADVEKAHKGASTQVVDLGGKTLMPSFIDAHSHYINALSVASQAKLYAPPAGPGKDVESIVAELKRFAADRKIPKGEMIMAYGYDDTVMPNGRLLNRDDLDKAFPDNPVRVDHVSMHGAVLNSLALKQYGIDAKTKTPSGGDHRPQAGDERTIRPDHGNGVHDRVRADAAAHAGAGDRGHEGGAPDVCRGGHHDRA
jgi:hypothetical protein